MITLIPVNDFGICDCSKEKKVSDGRCNCPWCSESFDVGEYVLEDSNNNLLHVKCLNQILKELDMKDSALMFAQSFRVYRVKE